MRRCRTAIITLAVAGLLGPAAVLAPAASAATSTVQQHFAITASQAAPKTEHVSARGRLKATGTAHAGKHKGVMWLVFKRGSVRLVLTQTSGSASVPNPTTCKFTEVFKGTYLVRGGTRAYAKAGGSGNYHTKIFGRLKRSDGSCTSKLASVYQGTWTWGTLHW